MQGAGQMFTTAQGVSKRSPRWGNGTKFSGWAYGLGNDQKNGPWFTYGTAGRLDIGGDKLQIVFVPYDHVALLKGCNGGRSDVG